MDAAISLLAAVILPAMEVLHSVHHLGFLDHLDAAADIILLVVVAVTLVLQITAVAGVAATATQVAAELACALQALPLQPTFNLHLALFAVKLQTFFATHTPSSVALTRQLPNL